MQPDRRGAGPVGAQQGRHHVSRGRLPGAALAAGGLRRGAGARHRALAFQVGDAYLTRGPE